MVRLFLIHLLRFIAMFVVFPLFLVVKQILKVTLFILFLPKLWVMGGVMIFGGACLFIGVPIGLVMLLGGPNPFWQHWLATSIHWGIISYLIYGGMFALGFLGKKLEMKINDRVAAWWERTDPNRHVIPPYYDTEESRPPSAQ